MSTPPAQSGPQSGPPNPPAQSGPAQVNRFTEKPLDYGAGVTWEQVLKYNTKGEYDFNRKILLKVVQQFWSTKQVIHFGFFMVGIVLIVVAALFWSEVKASFVVSYFLLGAGVSSIQGLFPHGLAKCDEKKSQMRAGQGCFSYLDCTNTKSLTRDQMNSCTVKMSTPYQAVRIVQFVLLIIASILVATAGKTKLVDSALSFFLGFGIFYVLTYAMV